MTNSKISISINMYIICCLCCADLDDAIVVCYPINIHHVKRVKFRKTTQRLNIITGVKLVPPQLTEINRMGH